MLSSFRFLCFHKQAMQNRGILMSNKVNMFKELDQRPINAYHNIAY